MNYMRFNLLTVWLALALSAQPALWAQSDAPPAPPAPQTQAPEKEKTPAPAEEPERKSAPETGSEETPEAVSPPAQSAEKEEPTAKPEEDEMRELGESSKTSPAKKTKTTTRVRRSRGGDAEPKMGDQVVSRDAIQTEAVTIVGNTTVDGHVRDVAVSVLGNTTVNGRVDGEAVSVFGSTTINGTVRGEAIAVFGDVILGPDAVVGREAIAVFGNVIKDPGAEVRGGIQQIGGFGFGDFRWLRTWIEKCLLRGRPLGFGEGLGWAWAIAGGFLIFYMLLALLFPRAVERCAEVLEQRPGKTVLTAVLATLLTPIVTILLAMTGVGLVLVPLIFVAGMFGKTAILAWFGRRVLVGVKDGFLGHPVIAVLLGGLIVALLYVIPILGFVVMKLLGLLGLGMVVYALILATNRPKPAAATGMVPPVQPVPPGAYVPPAASMSGVAASPSMEGEPLRDPSGGHVPPPVSPVTPAPAYVPTQATPVIISAVTLPRAGFWVRVAAALLDIIMVGIVLGLVEGMLSFNVGAGFMFWLALYCVVMWTKKGTTIGGVICGLKLVRVDDRPLDWGVCIVRALSSFLSLVVAGLGFIWVAFDDEKQSWHDKIAGTTIVKVPKGTPLL
jgi:uncharacterized RDD family membrane protein YckC